MIACALLPVLLVWLFNGLCLNRLALTSPLLF